MKDSVRSCTIRSTSPTPSFYRYLKPGALAQLRNSKITARSKEIGAHTLLALSHFQLSMDSAFLHLHSPSSPMERIPCFNRRVSDHPCCLQRRKLIAMTPCFPEAQY